MLMGSEKKYLCMRSLPLPLKKSEIFKQEPYCCAETALLAASVILGKMSVNTHGELTSIIESTKKACGIDLVCGGIRYPQLISLANELGINAETVCLEEAIRSSYKFPIIVRLGWKECECLNLSLCEEEASIFQNGDNWHVVLIVGYNASVGSCFFFDPNFSFSHQPVEMKMEHVLARSNFLEDHYRNKAIHLWI